MEEFKRGATQSTSDKEAGGPGSSAAGCSERQWEKVIGSGQEFLQCFHWNKVGGKKPAVLREENKGEEERGEKGEGKGGEGRGRYNGRN